ncbi:hypothetical protein [Pseudomonas fluorescens]|uniref:hypothetical protein n=1 Tax=Pseudomonas fluorescens TaxID=294 RepID=UPI0011C04AF1|nr:hypothetical protein [Pseudomonas fluorescens]
MNAQEKNLGFEPLHHLLRPRQERWGLDGLYVNRSNFHVQQLVDEALHSLSHLSFFVQDSHLAKHYWNELYDLPADQPRGDA